MSQEFKFSDPGEGLQEAEILEIHVSAGDTVSDGDTALTVETDKANTDIPAPFDGTIDEVRVSEGDTAQVGDVLMTYTESGESGEQSAESATSEETDEPSQEQEQEQEQEQGQEQSESGQAESEQTGEAEQESEREQTGPESQESGQGEETSTGAEQREAGPVPAAPSTRRIAREQGVDLHEVKPSGPEGRVTAEDVEAHAQSGSGQSSSDQSGSTRSQPAVETSPLTPGLAPPELPDFSQWGEIERMPLRSIRKATARNMARSWSQIPHVYHQDIADVTELERFRREHEAKNGKLTLTVLVMKALSGLLQRYPRFNASLDVENQEIVLKHYCHIGLAVATEKGLLVPAIRNVDSKSVTELAEETATVAQQARDGELGRADMQGASITVTNPGPLGGSSLTPLINHPQVAILGMAQARMEPVVQGSLDDNEVVSRLRLPLVLGFDHRVNDGADAARFVTDLIDALADPESLLMTV